MDRDLVDILKTGRVPSAGAASPTANLAPAVRTATVASASINTAGFHGFLGAFYIGAYGDAASGSVYVEAELQVSADNATWIPAADADILMPPGDAVRTAFGTTAASGCFFQSKTTGAADVAGLYTVGYLGAYQYLRVNVRFTAATTGCPCAVLLTAGFPDYSPVSGNPS
ncbi:MAG TPA: hypothetical protein VHY84_27350 [Bryobacteraceae bacterium]|jgi:hypothetical protein|nr:hypothetical protein [Bryobacteraceae bacterium]